MYKNNLKNVLGFRQFAAALKVNDDDCAGRSMIEMLGVLAIIAVLSVGGIAGYSKAMLMWRSNMQKQMISELIAAAIKIRPNLNPKSTKWEDLTPVLYAMGDIPEGVTYRYNRMHTKDGIRSALFYGLHTWRWN